MKLVDIAFIVLAGLMLGLSLRDHDQMGALAAGFAAACYTAAMVAEGRRR